VSCCGDNGATIHQEDIDRGLTFEIEYAGGRTVVVTGSVTGRRYEFSGMKRTQSVDPRDAGALLRNRAFRLRRVVQPAAT
jgi:hypothetical protein